MAVFIVTQQDLLILSIAAHVYILVELIANRMVEWFLPALSERCSMVRTMMSLHRQRPGLLAKLLAEQVTLWGIILIIMVALTYTSVSLTPFSHQPVPYPMLLIRIILNANVARFCVMGVRILLVKDNMVCQEAVVSTPSQFGHPKLDFIYNITSAALNFIYLGYLENLLLAITAAFMEVSSTPVECCQLIEVAKKTTGSQSYRKTVILTCILCVVCRLMLPLLLLLLALGQESPFNMDEIPLVSFFMSSIFYAAFNTLLLCQSARRMRKSSHQNSPQSFLNTSSISLPVSIHVLSNDAVETKISNDTELRDFNLGILRSVDNRNLYSSLCADDIDNVNVLKHKESSKFSLYKTAKRSNEDILSKINFTSCIGKNLEKSGSRDFLLDSQEVFSEKDASLLRVILDNERCDFKRSESWYDQSKDSSNMVSRVTFDNTDDAVCETNQLNVSGRDENVSRLLGTEQLNREQNTGSNHRNMRSSSTNEADITDSHKQFAPSTKGSE